MPAVLEPAQVGAQGPQGDPGADGADGDPGPPGPPGGSFEYSQLVASTLWGPIAHNLGYYPAVTTIDSAGTVVIGDVDHIDHYSLTVAFSVPFSGKASCT